jgi:[acyl-carrier-protein] S-malonyltransferase
MIAFTFPGQGSQRPGMGDAWLEHPSWELVDEAAAAADRDIARLLRHADGDELRETRNSQLTTFVLSLVVLDAIERLGVEPGLVAGHSLGEYTALVASGALSFDDGVRLVVARGEAMQSAAEACPGTMAAVIGVDDDKVELACVRVDEDVWVANYNAPGQVVIAGSPEGVAAATTAAKDLGAKKVLPLSVSGAFHTPYMSPARTELRAALAEADLRAPELPVYANVDALPHIGGDEWPTLLGAQLCSPVRWRQTLHHLDEAGATTFVELGPGNALTGMAKRTVRGSRTLSVGTPEELDKLLETLALPRDSAVGIHEGEHLFATERVVVSPSSGVFHPHEGIAPGRHLEPGDILGTVGADEVRSPFPGTIMGMLTDDGERVSPQEPIAWLRVGG